MTETASLPAFALAALALTLATLALVLRPLLREHRRLLVWAVGVALLAVPVLYARLGAVRAMDEAHVPDAATAVTARAVDSVRDDLAAQLAHNARDSRGWVLLARLELGQDRFAEAAAAYERALANPKAAADTTLWCEYAEALALAQGGRLAGRPREIIGRALAGNPSHRQALELAGSAAVEAGEYDVALAYWRMLLAQLPDGSSERRALGGAVARVELLAATGAGGSLH
jgi:cytochrome c-type biogenesis protein CcmH